jgi:glyoxylase-like metal-dependent hydrolase (beta-lactamase superfamily II)
MSMRGSLQVSLLSRRSLLGAALRSAVGVSLLGMSGLRAGRARAQTTGAETLALGDGLHVLTLGGTNVLAIVGDGATALVDGTTAALGPNLLAAVAALPGAGRVATLVNTHWHPEQTGSNAAIAAAGADIVAQVNTRLWLKTDVTWPWNGETVPPLPETAWPRTTFYETTELVLAGRQARCAHLRDCPHTDGDLYVHLPEVNVLAVGDAVYGVGWPSIDWWTGGWIGGLVGGIETLLGVADADTRIVPARGPVLSRAALMAQYEMYGTIWERLTRTLYSGGGPSEALASEPAKEFEATMGPAAAFVDRAFRSLWAYLSPDA